jgi:hypothetical protein
MDSSKSGSRRSFLKGVAASPILLVAPPAPSLAAAPGASAPAMIGPSTSTEPYLLPSITGAKTVSILTVGDSVGGYRMVGIPDGLGAFRTGHGEFTLLMNHEIANAGIPRAHGRNGAFVSRWTIEADTLKVIKGQDHTPSPQHVFLWDSGLNRYVQATTQWQRLCSADLPAQSAFFAHGLGTRERIFMDGEEVAEGRAWARIATGPHTGEAWQLPRLGRIAFENALACPFPQEKTIVVVTDDANLSTSPTPATGSPSEVYVYIGRKQASGTVIEQAGLTNGSLSGVAMSVDGRAVTEESDLFGLGDATTGYIGKGRFDLVDLGDVSALSTAALEAASIQRNVTRLQRCEDGAWDPRHKRQNDFYFVTTASEVNNCRLWRLRFDDIEHPEQGGTVEILLRGDEGHKMLDNVTIDRLGRILMDEDPGNSTRISKIWLYAIETREFIQVAAHNPKFFDGTSANNPNFITQDEESSGIIDAAHILGEGWFLFDVQAHKVNTADPELVEGGQLLALFVDPGVGFASCRGDRDDEDDDNRGRHR